MISLLLMKKIVELFIIMVVGYVIVRAGALKATDAKVLTNANIITMTIGFVFMFTSLRTPEVLDSAVHSFGSMIGPASMLIVGMTLAGLYLSELRRHRLAIPVVRLTDGRG